MNISIVIPTYNRPDHLERLLKSIEQQTHKGYEVIVVHDGPVISKAYESVIDNFTKIFKEFIFVCNESNHGAPFSRNRGIRIARYELLALVDDDDEWLPEKLDNQEKAFKDNSNKLGLVYTWTDVVENGKQLPFYRGEYAGQCLGQILNSCFIPSPSVMVRKRAILEAGLFDETLPSCQDWDMWTRICEKGYEVQAIKRTLTLYHKHAENSIGTSKNANIGYKMYYRKHFWKLVRYGELRHIVRLVRLSVGI